MLSCACDTECYRPCTLLSLLAPALVHFLQTVCKLDCSRCAAAVLTSSTSLCGNVTVQAGDDANALLTKFGTWQPSLHHTREPSVMEALIGSLGDAQKQQRVLLDVGAGELATFCFVWFGFG